MKLSKIVIFDEKENKEIELSIQDGCGMFITEDNNVVILPTNNSSIKYELLKQLLK